MVGTSSPAVVLTRESEDNRSLRSALEERGVPVREIPCLATRYNQPAKLPQPGFKAVTFSSRRGVRGVVRLDLTGLLMPPDVLVAAVGPATASELEASDLRVDLVADPPTGEALARALMDKTPEDSRIVAVRGNLRVGGMDTLLSKNGYRIEALEVYQNEDPGIPELDPFPVAAVVVASPSAARRLFEKNPWIKQYKFWAIGPTTAAALAGMGVDSITRLAPDSASWVDALTSGET